jgi:PBP1b-binding outer membrane lipoprotein LpoB
MKPSLIALISAILFLGSCSNNEKAAQDNTTHTINTTVDTVKQVDTVKSDTVALKKSSRVSEEERDQKIMDDILRNKKTMK